MRIDDVNRSSQPSAPQGPERANEKSKKEQSSAGSSDQVQISNLADALNATDTSRLDALRLQVQSGTYKIDPHAVANSLIDDHLKEK